MQLDWAHLNNPVYSFYFKVHNLINTRTLSFAMWGNVFSVWYSCFATSLQFTPNIIKSFLCYKTFSGFHCPQDNVQNPYQCLKILFFLTPKDSDLLFSPYPFPWLSPTLLFLLPHLLSRLCHVSVPWFTFFCPSGTYLFFHCWVSFKLKCPLNWLLPCLWLPSPC